MLEPRRYAALYAAFSARGIQLLKTPEAYRSCHYLPDSYPFIEGHTPRSVWVPVRGEVNWAAVATALMPFGSAPVIVKDYVKSKGTTGPRLGDAQISGLPSAELAPALYQRLAGLRA